MKKPTELFSFEPEKNNIDKPIYNRKGENIGFIDIFTDIDKTLVVDPDDSTKITIFLIPPKQI